MQHFAANYVFDGVNLIKNSFVTLNKNKELIYVGEPNEALIEKARMIFFNGIISPGFIAKDTCLESQIEALEKIKQMCKENKSLSLLDILKMFTKKESIDSSSNLNTYLLKQGNKIQIILLENVDLLNLKLKDDTFVKILC